jgi:hypothetical protein
MSPLTILNNNSNLTLYSNQRKSQLNTLVNIYAVAPRQDLRTFAAFLKLNSLTRVTNAIDIAVVDSISNELRFNVNYQLQSTTTNIR